MQTQKHISPQASRAGRVPIAAFVPPEVRKALRQLALDQDTTVQELVEHAIADVLKRARRHV